MVESEMETLLLEYDIDAREFSEEVEECLPKESPWTIPKVHMRRGEVTVIINHNDLHVHIYMYLRVLQEEEERRRDFRGECVFTIDPETARVRAMIFVPT